MTEPKRCSTQTDRVFCVKDEGHTGWHFYDNAPTQIMMLERELKQVKEERNALRRGGEDWVCTTCGRIYPPTTVSNFTSTNDIICTCTTCGGVLVTHSTYVISQLRATNMRLQADAVADIDVAKKQAKKIKKLRKKCDDLTARKDRMWRANARVSQRCLDYWREANRLTEGLSAIAERGCEDTQIHSDGTSCLDTFPDDGEDMWCVPCTAVALLFRDAS